MTDVKQEKKPDSFGFVDVLRVLGGVIFLNAFLSWWFTSSSTWGYDGKWINTSYLAHRITNNFVNLTLEELSLFNGTDSRLPIYVAVNGSVYDVSASRGIYGPKGSYRMLSGKDAARVYVTGCFRNPAEYTYDLRGLDEEEASHDVKEWQIFYEHHPKYWLVGHVQHEVIQGEPPEPCEHVKFPGYHAPRSH
ncbi:cytochrome b5-like heme/steroid binding domain-containing protein [Scheffersomyces xylosifermentans]|uniref:cytochrome b5-like heme/steroid binding domain-containing protein n=1 Tax=Scheffersomyces xylosifermentans TaxID=1304137 RepID=UPI00315D8D52